MNAPANNGPAATANRPPGSSLDGATDRDGGSPAPIDRPIVEFFQTRLRATQQVEQATITDASGHFELQVSFASPYYLMTVNEATLTIRWYTTDDFTIHYREMHPESAWECRWDRHPNHHNIRDHFHRPPGDSTPGDDASWPTDHRDVLTLVLDEVEARIAALWDE